MTIIKVFNKNGIQAVLLPANMSFPQHRLKVNVRLVGRDRIITPVEAVWDSFFVNPHEPTKDFIKKRAAQHQPERDHFAR